MYIMIFTSSSKTVQKRHSETFVYPWFRTGSAWEGGGDSVCFRICNFPHCSILSKGRFQKFELAGTSPDGEVLSSLSPRLLPRDGSCIFGMPGVFCTWKGKEGGHVR